MHIALNWAQCLKMWSTNTETKNYNQISHMNDGYSLTTCKILKIRIGFFTRLYFTNCISSICIFSNLIFPSRCIFILCSVSQLLDKSRSTGNQEKCNIWYSMKWKCVRVIAFSAIADYRDIPHNRNNCSSFW